MNYNKKTVLVFGAGESGEGALMLLKRLGAKPYVFDEDENKANALANVVGAVAVNEKSLPDVLSKAVLGIISPGIQSDCSYVVMARAMGVKIVSEIEFASTVSKGYTVTVTGTNGKSSTVRLLSNVLNGAGKYAVACGNIGKAYSKFADKLNEDDIAVVEASSFQLENIVDFHTDIAILLNVTQDHVDRHGNVEGYVSAKKNIFRNSSGDDYIIANYDDLTVREMVNSNKNAKKVFFSVREKIENGVYLFEKRIYSTLSGTKKEIADLEQNLKPTTHIENVLAVFCVAELMNLSNRIVREKINSFVPSAHTMEKVMTRKGVSYVDDSKGTNVSATLHAVNSIDGKMVLIVGGREKGENYSVLFDNLPEKVENLVFLGENAESLFKLANQKGKCGKIAQSMLSAVEFATELLDGEGTVLFSPACASFDNYSNYKERGEAFVFAVNSYDK